MTQPLDNPFLAGVDPSLLAVVSERNYIKIDVLITNALAEAMERTARAQPFGDFEAIKAAHPVRWWDHLCCWHDAASRWGPGSIVKDRWGNLDPERPGEAFDKVVDAQARAKELNSSDEYCIREPLPKEI